VICKLLVDQLLFAPVSTIMLFAALELMKGTPEQIPIVIQVHTQEDFQLRLHIDNVSSCNHCRAACKLLLCSVRLSSWVY